MDTILCCEGKIIQQVTHTETLANIEKLKTFFIKQIPEKSCVLLYMSHNIHLPAIILSLKSCGHCFVPIDINTTKNEIEEVVQEAKINLILSFDNNRSFENFQLKGDLELGRERIQLWKNNIFLENTMGLKDLLCIISSSGTTGRRKLIKIETYCIEQNVEYLSQIFNLDQNDVIYFGTPLTFDPSLVELFLAVKTGAVLLIVSESTKLNSKSLFQTLFPTKSEYPSITFLQMVPSLFTRWSKEQIQYILHESQLKILALGGEPFPSGFLSFQRSVKLYNLYGLTEISCWAMIYEIQEDNEVFLGQVLGETEAKVCCNEEEIDEGLGELYIGSNTRHCYVNNETQKIIWRSTGDLVDKTKDGIRYLGRKNSWIKRLGHKICLCEIEKKVYEKTQLPSKCIWDESHSKLLLFLSIPTIHLENKVKLLDKLKVKLLHILLKEEFPDFIDIMSTFPVTHHGKIDKNSMIEIYKQSRLEMVGKPLCDYFLMELAKYLGHSISDFERIKNYTFFELGGNSILYTLLTNDFGNILNYDLPSEFLSLLFNENIECCANFLKNVKLPKSTSKRKCEIGENTTVEEKKHCFKNIKVIWKYNLQGCVDAPPLVFEKNSTIFVAVGSFANFFAMLDAVSGELIFLKAFPDSIGSQATVSACMNFLYFGCFDGNVYCINMDKNNIQWSYPAGDSIKCSPSLCNNNEALVFGSYDKYLHCISAKTGLGIWKSNIQESILATPVVHESTSQILVTTLLGSCISVSEKEGTVNWCIKLGNPIFGSSCKTKADALIFADVHGNLHSIDIKTGKKISNIKVESIIYSSVIVMENHVIFSCNKGFLYKCEINNNYFAHESIEKIYLEESISATPCIFEYLGKTFISVFTIHGNLYLINFQNMEIFCCWKSSGDVFSSPIFYKNKLYFGCRDDNLYCLDIHSLF